MWHNLRCFPGGRGATRALRRQPQRRRCQCHAWLAMLTHKVLPVVCCCCTKIIDSCKHALQTKQLCLETLARRNTHHATVDLCHSCLLYDRWELSLSVTGHIGGVRALCSATFVLQTAQDGAVRVPAVVSCANDSTVRWWTQVSPVAAAVQDVSRRLNSTTLHVLPVAVAVQGK